MSNSHNASVKVTVTVEMVDTGARLLRQTIVIDQTSESELRWCDDAGERDRTVGHTAHAGSEKLRLRVVNFMMWVAGLALALVVGELMLCSLIDPLNAIAAASVAALMVQSAIRAAAQIAVSSQHRS